MNWIARSGEPSVTGRSELPTRVTPWSRNPRPRYSQPARSLPHHRRVVVAEVPQEVGLDHRAHAERGEPGQLVGADQAGVFDAVAGVGPGPELLGAFQGVQGEVGGAVPDGVDGELPAGEVAVDDGR